MKPYLLDTNVLITLAWPNHVHHRDVVEWFAAKGAKAFRTCPATQTSFVRISSNTAFTPNPLSPAEAIALLRRLMALSGHGFWSDDVSLADGLGPAPALATHRQVTDAYLLALAAAHDGVLATLDRGILPLALPSPDRLELVAG